MIKEKKTFYRFGEIAKWLVSLTVSSHPTVPQGLSNISSTEKKYIYGANQQLEDSSLKLQLYLTYPSKNGDNNHF